MRVPHRSKIKMSFANKLVNTIKTLVYNPALNGDKKAIREGLKQCTQASKLVSTALKNASGIGEKNHLLSCMAQIKGFRELFKAAEVTGFGYVPRRETATHRVKWEDLNSAFQSRIRTGVILNIKHGDVKAFLEDCAVMFKRRIQNALKKDEALKVNAVLCGEFQIQKADKTLCENKYLNTHNATIYKDTDLDGWFRTKIQDPLLTDLDEFQERDSGWTLSRVVNLVVNINKYNPLRAGSYIDLPKIIAQRKACVNVKNTDNMCFVWSIMAALYPVNWGNHPDRPSSYPDHKNVLNLTGIQFPMTIGQIPRFEKQNNVSINVYRLDKVSRKKFTVIPYYLCKNKTEKHVNLLLLQDVYATDANLDDLTPVKFHYVWIKNISRLLSAQLSKENGQKFICDRCLHYFRSEQKLEMHTKDCLKLNKGVVPQAPKEDQKWVDFKDFKNKEKAPFVIYADTECLLVPVEDDSAKNTQNLQTHVPYSVGYYVKCSYDDTLSFYKSYTGSDCMQWFVKELQDFAENVETVFLCDLPMNELTPEEMESFYSSTVCHICEKPFTEDDKRVRDHSHLTGSYRGAGHARCNLQYQDSYTIPVLFHNLSCYDGHMVIKALAAVEGQIDILPVNKEKYISFTKHIKDNLVQFRFVDSYRFLASGLDKLAKDLPEYPILRSEFSNLSEEQYSLLSRKGVFPYDFIDGWLKLEGPKLPSKVEFYNSLEDSLISDEEYAHAQKVWASFNCKSVLEYSELYMKTDILLLADIFERFRATSHQTYGLDPVWSYTLPGYAWSCMLFQLHKSNHAKLELLTDLDMIYFIERGIRGGLSQCSKRYAEANNKFLPDYNPAIDDVYLMYFDINNQYGWAMSQYLPYGEFKWLPEDEITQLNVSELGDNKDTGYILEVDLETPEYLHDKFSDLPPCPQHGKPPGSKNEKLLATLSNKFEYVIHYRNLKQALALGVKVSKVHRVLSFRQSPWLKSYIDLNTGLRQAAKNDFEKNLFKLMNNAVFGKTMENIRKHSSVKLIMNWDGRYGAEALVSRPEFKTSTIINEQLVIIELAKSEVYFNKPIYVGMCILDLAKTTIYDFHYNYMYKTFGDQSKVLYTDTDSLIYEIKHGDVYEVMRQDCHAFFDTSDYPETNIYNISRVNKKVLGMMKDENNGRIMTHFVGLRSKMYATKVLYSPEEIERERIKLEKVNRERSEIERALANLGVVKKIKGVKKSVIKNKITFDDYVECLETFTEKPISQKLIRSTKHDLHTIRQTKIGLSPHDDKRRISKTSCDTLAWGHYSIMEED